MKNLNEKFLEELAKTKEPIHFLGIANILGVKIVSEEKDENGKFAPREFLDILEDIMKKYSAINRNKKRELLTVLKKGNKDVNKNASRTKNSEKE